MTQQTLLPGRKPTHRIYRVAGEGANSNWTPIGAAWPNKDGAGFNIICDAVPLQGRIVMRAITERSVESEPSKDVVKIRRRRA